MRQNPFWFDFKLLLVTFYLWNVSCSAQQYVGDVCLVARTGGKGTCKIIDDCPVVISEIVKQSLFPTSCGFVGHRQIVCCPNAVVVAVATAAPNLTRISQKKCAEYRSLLISKSTVAVGFLEEPVVKEVLRCDILTVPLVVGGEDARAKEFPHMALIGYQDEGKIFWGCGGTLISDEYVLTAAHCVYGNRQVGYAEYVRLGDLDIDNERDDSQPIQVNISERIKHPNYKIPSKYHDIALLRLAQKVQLNAYIRPACLADTFQPTTAKAVATGWGLTQFSGKPSKRLLKVVLELYTHEECNQTYSNDINRALKDGIIHEQQVCAGSHEHERDTCQGDSGGPLQLYHPHQSCMYEIIGITSFGKGCGNINTPGVYTRVYHYLDWIEGIVWPGL